MKKLRACVVSHSYPTKQATAQASFIKNEAHLLAEDLEVEVHLPAVYALPFQNQYDRSREPDEEKLPVHRFKYLSFPNRRLATFTQKSLTKNLLKSIEHHNPDVVHLHWLYPAGLAAPAIARAGYPVVLTIHGGDWNLNRSNKHLMPLLEKSLSACDKIICVGKQLVEDIGSYNPKFKKKLVHIPHGIDAELFHPQFDIKDEDKFSWATGKKNILCVANLYHGKGIDLLIEAVSATLEKDRYHLHIISPAGDAETKSKIKNLIELHSLRETITFYGAQNQDQLADFYRAADLVVLPSRKEGFGLVVAEAIACGTPVLATRSGGPQEIVTSDCGILVDSDSAENLANGLTDILNTLDNYQAEKMHQYIKNNFSIHAKKRKLMSVYREITN